MNCLVISDLGHDPDDFFALCYLISAGVNIRGIVVTPGDPDQIAIAKLLTKEIGLDIPIGASHDNRQKLSSGSIHHQLLNKYGHKLSAMPDGHGYEVVSATLKAWGPRRAPITGFEDSDCEAFVIGPVTSLGEYLKDYPTAIKRATMQGGFLGYDLHTFPCKRLDKFKRLIWQPTFNLNGDREGAVNFLNADIKERRFVGKNVCHTIIYNAEVHKGIKTKDRASELFKEGMDMYLDSHGEKKFHDPSAACCHLHPEIGSWVRGNVRKIQKGWGTELNNNGDYILADIDYNALWDHILNFK